MRVQPSVLLIVIAGLSLHVSEGPCKLTSDDIGAVEKVTEEERLNAEVERQRIERLARANIEKRNIPNQTEGQRKRLLQVAIDSFTELDPWNQQAEFKPDQLPNADWVLKQLERELKLATEKGHSDNKQKDPAKLLRDAEAAFQVTSEQKVAMKHIRRILAELDNKVWKELTNKQREYIRQTPRAKRVAAPAIEPNKD